jgi:dipeptide/tripeptide permease
MSSTAATIACTQPACGHANMPDAQFCAGCGQVLTATVAAVEPAARLSRTFWLGNVIEMWERLAYYTLRPVAPIYIMQATEPGGLHLTAAHKGAIYAWWAAFQSLLPTVTGGFADRYGYKRMLALSITLNIAGYLTMAFTHGYVPFFAGILLLATGTAFFKPSIQATLGACLNKNNSSLGWGTMFRQGPPKPNPFSRWCGGRLPIFSRPG